MDKDLYIEFLEKKVKNLEADMEFLTQELQKDTPTVQYIKSKNKYLSKEKRKEYVAKIYKEISQYDYMYMTDVETAFTQDLTPNQVKYIVKGLVTDERVRVEKEPIAGTSKHRVKYIASWRDKCNKVPL